MRDDKWRPANKHRMQALAAVSAVDGAVRKLKKKKQKQHQPGDSTDDNDDDDDDSHASTVTLRRRRAPRQFGAPLDSVVIGVRRKMRNREKGGGETVRWDGQTGRLLTHRTARHTQMNTLNLSRFLTRSGSSSMDGFEEVFSLPRWLAMLIRSIRNQVQTEGLFRVPASASLVEQTRTDIDSGNFEYLEGRADPHVCCALLKQFLRALPTPLLTVAAAELLSAAVVAADSNEPTPRVLRVCCEKKKKKNS